MHTIYAIYIYANFSKCCFFYRPCLSHHVPPVIVAGRKYPSESNPIIEIIMEYTLQQNFVALQVVPILQ